MRPYPMIALLCLTALPGCMHPGFMSGGERDDPLWDRINFKECYEDNLRARTATILLPQEKPPEEQFGSCSEDDLANRTCK